MSIISAIAQLLSAGGDYQISRSVRLRSSASANLSRTFAAVPSVRTKQTVSAWIKRGALGSNQGILSGYDGTSASRSVLYFTASDQLAYDNGGSAANLVSSTAVYRDPSAWYHVVLSIDTTQATAANRVLLYVNGVQLSSFSSANYPAQNSNTQLALNTANNFIGELAASNWYFDGYLTEVNFIDGQALTPSSFGQTDPVTGVWQPKKYTGTYGTNGFYLNFSDNSAATATTIGKDYSGNGNNWTPNNISVTAGVTYDSMLDTPTPYADGGNGRGNYPVLNPLIKATSGAQGLSNANLNSSISTAGSAAAVSTMGVSSGKWYWEATITNISTAFSYDGMVGVTSNENDSTVSTASQRGYIDDGNKWNGSAASAYGATFTTNDIIGVALDCDNGTLAFYKNNVSQGTAISTGITGVTWFPFFGSNNTCGCAINFGQRPFSYTPPTGFKALNTQNLPDSTIKKGNQYFDATTYTGNGGTNVIVNAGGFQPDFLWIKSRSAAYDHALQDSVRGMNLALYSNLTNAEVSAGYASANSNGFNVAGTVVNNGGSTFVGWQWKKGATQGFDIVTYTGNGANRTVAHSLGVTPSLMIIKSRSAALHWPVYHASMGAVNLGFLDMTNAWASSPTTWNSTAPTSSVFSLGTDATSNQNGATFVAYLFAEVAGFSKFGLFTGNGSADGPFIFTGFKPRFVMVKRTDTTSSWEILDSSRDPYNAAIQGLQPNLSNAESSPYTTDFLSNGFKARTTNTDINASGGTYIFAAFAEVPFRNALAR